MAPATLGIISIGEMGLGISKLLLAHKYRVITNASDRSHATQARARDNGIELVLSDVELCNAADYILSIVPPRDSIDTARRILEASHASSFNKSTRPRYYLDLNAISPRCAREIDTLFAGNAHFRYIDGGIIGGPPSLNSSGTWERPSIPVSGPHRLSEAEPSGEHLANILNVKHINSTIGSATGLKMCFASLSKGFTALAIQSFTAAKALGVVDELRAHLDEYNPGARNRAERGLVSMVPKAYRWVNEMEQIAETFEADGGFIDEESTFRAIARIYGSVAEEPGLGKGSERQIDAEDVAGLLLEGHERRKVKKE